MPFFYDRLRKDQDDIINIKGTLEKVLIELSKGIREIIIDIGIKPWSMFFFLRCESKIKDTKRGKRKKILL